MLKVIKLRSKSNITNEISKNHRAVQFWKYQFHPPTKDFYIGTFIITIFKQKNLKFPSKESLNTPKNLTKWF